jgi:hypothetical protein
VRARKVDANLGAIVEIARKVGFLVHVTNSDWDATVQLAGMVELWEVKAPRGRPTALQERMRKAGWTIHTIRTAEDVLRARKRLTAADRTPGNDALGEEC